MQVPGQRHALPRTLNICSTYAGGGAGVRGRGGGWGAPNPGYPPCYACGGRATPRRARAGPGGLRQRTGRGGGGGGTTMSEAAVADTRRLNAKPQDLTDAYGPPSNFLEIDIFNPQTVGMGRARYTSYELRMRVRPPWGGRGAQASGPAAGRGALCGPRRGWAAW